MFFQNITTREKDRLLVEGIIRVVRQFDIIQGYVFYKPMPQDVYERLLQCVF